MSNADVVALDDSEVGIVEPDTVGGDGTAIEDAQGFQGLDR